jgi:hypothetical protein
MSRCRCWLWLCFVVFLSLPVRAASLAEGFTRLPEGAVVLLMPLDIELFSVSAGGILEPQAEWTEKAHANLRQAFLTRSSALKVNFMPLPGEVESKSSRASTGCMGRSARQSPCTTAGCSRCQPRKAGSTGRSVKRQR